MIEAIWSQGNRCGYCRCPACPVLSSCGWPHCGYATTLVVTGRALGVKEPTATPPRGTAAIVSPAGRLETPPDQPQGAATVTARIGVVTFPGSLDDRDALRAVKIAGGEPVALWHGDHDLKSCEAVILPGGFSYGDYLRCGAIARFARIMTEVVERANA